METYLQVLTKFRAEEKTSEAAFLLPIYMGHENAVSSLQNHIRQMGDTPVTHPSNGGAWAKFIQGSKKCLPCKPRYPCCWKLKKTALQITNCYLKIGVS